MHIARDAKKELLAAGCLVLALAVAGCGGSRNSAGGAGRGSADSTPSRQKAAGTDNKESGQETLQLEVLIIDAKMQQELGNDAKAITLWRQVLGKDPACAVACYEMSRLMDGRQMTDSATVYGARAVKLDGGNKWYKLHLADLYGRTGNYRKEAQMLESLIELEPYNFDYYYSLSDAHIAAGDLTKAIETLGRVERAVGVSEPVSLRKQQLWEALGKQDKALKEIEALAAAMPHEKKYNAMLAESCMGHGDYVRAKQYYDRILAADPDDPYIHISLASYYKTTGKPGEAYKELRAGFENSALPCGEKMRILANFYSQEEFFGTCADQTAALMDMAVAGCDNPAEYAGVYGHILLGHERYAEAAAQYAIALRKDSSDFAMWEGLLLSLNSLVYADGDSVTLRDTLSRYAKRANRLFPTHTLPYYLLAHTSYDAGDYAEAVKLLRRAEMSGFNKGYLEPECNALLTDCLYMLKKHDEAFAAYESYLKRHPDDMLMLNNYAYRLAEQGRDLEKAEQMSRTTVKAEPNNPTFLDTYAWVLHKLGRNDEARNYIQQACSRYPSPDKVPATIAGHYDTIFNSK